MGFNISFLSRLVRTRSQYEMYKEWNGLRVGWKENMCFQLKLKEFLLNGKSKKKYLVLRKNIFII
jgi:hypothetical protein